MSANDLAGLVDCQSIAESSVTPAQTDHLVKRGPVRERVIGRVDDRQASSLGNIVLERFPNLLRPRLAVVVAQHDVVFGEIRTECVPQLTLGFRARRRHHIDRESARSLELGFHRRRHRTPVVVVLPVDDQHTHFFGSRSIARYGQSQRPSNQKSRTTGPRKMPLISGLLLRFAAARPV